MIAVPLSSRKADIPRCSLALIVLLCLVYSMTGPTFWSSRSISDLAPHDFVPTDLQPTDSEARDRHAECRSLPMAEKVMVVMKTGATEIYDKLPTHLTTLFRCTPHFIIFSDLTQNISDYQVHDALESISARTKHLEEFSLYWKLKRYHREGLDVRKLKGKEGWKLDKWKFLPMLHKTYGMSPPNIDWFVFVEADTSLSWLNLLNWLETLNPARDLYAGSQNKYGSISFAHGGSGIVVSRKSMEKLIGRRQEMGTDSFDKDWDSIIEASCCGDVVLAQAFLDAGVSLTPSWPLTQGENVQSLDWTERHWCVAAVTWHHMASAQIDSMWQFEADWISKNGWNTPYLFRDVFEHTTERHISVNRTRWDNLSQDIQYSSTDAVNFHTLLENEKYSVESFEMCAQACRSQSECIQWMWRSGDCRLGFDIRLGSIDESGEESWSSGWVHDRVDDMRADMQPCNAHILV